MVEVPVTTNLTPEEALRLIIIGRFLPFTKTDWYAFAGVKSDNPRIAEVGKYILVWDDDIVNIIEDGDRMGGQVFQLVDANA